MLPPGRRVLLETSPHRLTPFDVPADPGCPDHVGHTAPDLVSSQDHSAPGSALLRELALDRERVDLHLDHEVVVRWRCRCEGSVRRPGVPLRRLRGPCQDCGATPDSLDTTMSLQGTDPLLDRPLSELGVPDGGEILLFDGTRTIQVRLSTTQRVLRPEREPSRGSVP
jgi:hypothetical protein